MLVHQPLSHLVVDGSLASGELRVGDIRTWSTLRQVQDTAAAAVREVT
jgi:hypothetical protein